MKRFTLVGAIALCIAGSAYAAETKAEMKAEKKAHMADAMTTHSMDTATTGAMHHEKKAHKMEKEAPASQPTK